jgi:hypothetical protein
MSQDYLPHSDLGLLSWAQSAGLQFVEHTADYGLSPAQVSSFTTAVEAYSTALSLALGESTRTKVSIFTKNEARKALMSLARTLVRQIQGTASVPEDRKIAAGIPVHDKTPSPVPPPDFAPDMDIIRLNGRIVRVRLHNADSVGNRRKPEGVHGAILFYCLGDAPSADSTAWV